MNKIKRLEAENALLREALNDPSGEAIAKAFVAKLGVDDSLMVRSFIEYVGTLERGVRMADLQNFQRRRGLPND